MKLLLTDSSHALGQALEHELEREPFGLILPRSAQLTWTDPGEVRAYFDHQSPGLVINTLGWADNPDTAQCRLIRDAARLLAEVCHERALPMIQLSSYRVFGGNTKSSHSEKDVPAPQSEAGQAWFDAEQVVAERLKQYVTLRLSWVIDSHGNNRLTRLLEGLFSSDTVSVNARLKGCPTALSDVARVVVGVIRQIDCGADNWGVMHYASRDACTEQAFAERVLEVLEQLDAWPPQARLESTDCLSQDEPVSAVLGIRKLRDGFGVQARSWEPYLVPMVRQWLHHRSSESL
ncbi:sugar nucleotide-binding protein [Marinimicrobium sp. ARAG 43.8]|uniref:sugar nucleotide-binding protein n=1 Tax=Marinimicrobium sp. ARAG 43.8 TaxID=3418719 RepID=UPI003CF86FA2